MNLYYGIRPFVMKFPKGTDDMISESEKALRNERLVKRGDSIVIIASSPFRLGGKSNILKLHRI
jgi:pyruvate kinase